MSDELIFKIAALLVPAIIGAVAGAYTAGRSSSDTRHTLRGEINENTLKGAVAFGRLEERVNQSERAIAQNHAAAFTEIRRVETSVERQFRIINIKLDALISGRGLKLRREDEDEEPGD